MVSDRFKSEIKLTLQSISPVNEILKMNICILRTGVILLFCMFSNESIHSQAIINAKVGVESWSLLDEKELSGQSNHPGQLIGFDVFIEKNRALFVPGFHYHRISIENEDVRFDVNFNEAHHIHYFTIPLTFGYTILEKSFLDVSLLAGGEINFFYNLDDNNVGLDDDMLYGVSTGLTGMVHLTFFSILTAEIKYHHALQPIIKIRDDSKLRGMTLAVGVRF